LSFRQHVGNSNHRGYLVANMNKSDDIETLDEDPLDGDENKIQNWLFLLVLPLQLVYVSNHLTRSSIYYLVDFSSGVGDAAPDPFRAMNVAIGFS